jgi:hypothetical protein
MEEVLEKFLDAESNWTNMSWHIYHPSMRVNDPDGHGPVTGATKERLNARQE